MPVLKKEQIEEIIKLQDFDVPEGYQECSNIMYDEDLEDVLQLLKVCEKTRIERALKEFNIVDGKTLYNVNIKYYKDISITKNGYCYDVYIDEQEQYHKIDLDIHIDYTINTKDMYCSIAFSGKNLMIITDIIIPLHKAHVLAKYYVDIAYVLDEQ